MLQQTLGILSQALPAQGNARLPLDQTLALVNVSDDKFERAIVSLLHDLLKMHIPGASSLVEEVRTSCLRVCPKSLWHCGKAYHQAPDPLPSYFPLVLARPEISRHFQTEEDPVARMTGCCFGALLVSKLVDTLESHISLSGRVRNAELACISAILGTEHRFASPASRHQFPESRFPYVWWDRHLVHRGGNVGGRAEHRPRYALHPRKPSSS